MNKKDFILFLIASAFIGMSQSIDSSVLNNFLNDTYNITISQRTILEIPREFPGFMVVFLSSMLLFLGDIRIAAIANILSAFGILGVAFFSPTLISMLPWMILYSTGIHLFLPVSNSIAITLGVNKDDVGTVVSIIMVFMSALLTGIGVYDKIANFAGAGTIVPITGFANSIVSPAMEFKKEGYVFGVAAKMFTIAGPVLVYGIGSSVIVGLIYFVINKLKFII